MIARVVSLAIGGLLVAGVDARFADQTARDLIRRSREAVSRGSSRELRSLVMKGLRRVPLEGSDTADGPVEIKILLPDKFLRIDALGANERRSGFAGRDVLTPRGDLRRERAQLTRLMLGLAAYASDDLTIQSTGEAAFADTTAVDVNGPGFSGRLVLDATTCVPLRVVYFVEGGVSTVMSFANRRPVDGWDLPFRITTQTPDRVLETLMLDEIQVNPKLTERDFSR
jgi:hypothetical protein